MVDTVQCHWGKLYTCFGINSHKELIFLKTNWISQLCLKCQQSTCHSGQQKPTIYSFLTEVNYTQIPILFSHSLPRNGSCCSNEHYLPALNSNCCSNEQFPALNVSSCSTEHYLPALNRNCCSNEQYPSTKCQFLLNWTLSPSTEQKLLLKWTISQH